MSEQTPRGARFFIETFGCQMNVNDSERVAGLLAAEGYSPTDDPALADFVFVNTCAVREKAAQKLFSSLGRLRRSQQERPNLKIGVGGCVAQLEGTALFGKAKGIDVLVGTHNLRAIPQLLERAWAGESGLHDLDRKVDAFGVPSHQVAHSSPVRAYLTIMEGCNHVCSFCVVPRTRGPEVCRSLSDIVSEARELIGRGYAEIMLLGQTVNAWRMDGADFADLLGALDALPGLQRLRFTTSHPEHVTERLAGAFGSLRTLCPYLHLPVQSGSDRILAAMRRGYTRQGYLEKIRLLRDRRPDLALSTDVIVGYPTESEEDFQATVSLLDAVKFDTLFSFSYSARPGTTAFFATDDVPSAEKRRRLRLVNERQQRQQKVALAALVGSRQQVTIDSVSPEDEGRIAGRTPHFRIVHLAAPSGWMGKTIEVEIEAAGANSLMGRAVATPIL